MIKKKGVNQLINKLETLIKRLPKSFPTLQTIENDLAYLYDYQQVKQKIIRYLRQLPKHFTIFYDLSLEHNKPFHLDVLILTSHAIFIIQIKTSNNSITKPSQMIQNHLTNVRLAQPFLYQWLKKRNLHMIPIYFLTVTNDTRQNKQTSLAQHLPVKLMKYYNYIKQSRKCRELTMKKIIHEIHINEYDEHLNILNQYKISRDKIKTGVCCPNCQQFKMAWICHKWVCEKCKYININAHNITLHDYFTLIRDSICIDDCLWFLNIDCKITVKKLLNNSPFIYNKKNKKWINDCKHSMLLPRNLTSS